MSVIFLCSNLLDFFLIRCTYSIIALPDLTTLLYLVIQSDSGEKTHGLRMFIVSLGTLKCSNHRSNFLLSMERKIATVVGLLSTFREFGRLVETLNWPLRALLTATPAFPKKSRKGQKNRIQPVLGIFLAEAKYCLAEIRSKPVFSTKMGHFLT